ALAMNNADVLFPWEREGGERDANAPDAAGLPVDPHAPAAEQRTDDTDPAATPDAAEDAADVQAAGAEQGDAPTGAQAAGEPIAGGTDADADDPIGEPAKGQTPPDGADEDDDARFAVLDTDYARKAAERASAALRE